MFAVAAGRLMQGVDYEPMRHRVVMIPPISTVVILWYAFGGIIENYSFPTYNYFPLEQRQLFGALMIRDLSAIAERPGASGEI